MAIQVASLYGVLRMQDDEFRRSAENARGEMLGLGDRLKDVGQRVTGFGAQLTAMTAPLAAFGVAGISAASSFQSSMAEISARTGLTGADLQQISDFALKMGADTAFSAQEAADAFLQLLSSGQTAEEAIATLPAVMDAAAASGEDLGRTADTVTDIMAMFGLGVESAGSIVDTLAQAAGASSADMASLGQGFANVGGVAKSFGLSVEDTAAVLAIFAENGVKGAEAGTQLKSMLLSMARPTKEVQGAWKRLGLSMYDASGNARPLEDVIRELDTALDKLPVEEQNKLMQTLAGSYGIVGLNALRGSISISEMQTRMGEQASAADIAQKRMETFAGRMDSLKGSVETLMISAMTPFMENVLTPLIEQVTAVVNSITGWIGKNPVLAQQIVKVMAAVVGIGPALMIAGKAISAIGGQLTFLMSPIGLIVGAITGLVIAFETNFMGIRDLMQPVIDTVVGGFETLLGVIRNLGNIISNQGIGPAIDAIINAFAQMFGLVGKDDFFEPLRGIGDKIMTVFLTVATFIQNKVIPALGQLYNWFITDAMPVVVSFIQSVVVPAVQGFIQIVSDIWARVAPFLGNLFNWFVTDALPTIVGFINGTVMPAIQRFIDILVGFWTSIQPGVDAFFNWVTKDALPLVVDFFTNTLQPVIDLFIDVLLTLWETVSPTLSSLFNWFMTDGLPFITDVIQGAMDNFITPFINLLVGIWNAVKPTFDALKTNLQNWWFWLRDNVWQPLIDKIKGVIDFVNNLLTQLGLVQQSSNDALNQTTANTFPTLPTMPGYDGGGYTGDGEPGEPAGVVHPREFVVPEEGALVMRGGGDTYNVNVYANSEAEGRAAARGFKDELRILMQASG